MPRPKAKGKRTRFAGFELTSAQRDRVVAKWINEQPNASEAIKHLIYQVATGQFAAGYGVQAAMPQAVPPQPREPEKRDTGTMLAFSGGEVGEDIPEVNTEDPDAAALFGAFGN